MTWAYILLAGESRVKEKVGKEAGRQRTQPVISIVPPAFLEPLTQYSDIFGVISAAIEIWLLPAAEWASLYGPSVVGRLV